MDIPSVFGSTLVELNSLVGVWDHLALPSRPVSTPRPMA